MAPPIYFLPDTTHKQFRPGGGKVAEGFLAARRLDKVLADVPLGRFLASDLHRLGPGDSHGMLLRAEAAKGDGISLAPRLDYLSDVQSWQGVVDPTDPLRHLYWLGLDKIEPPKPADLARMSQVEGPLVKMADGQLWKAPMVRRPQTVVGGMPHVSGLPMGVSFGFNSAATHILPAYQDIWLRSARVFDVIWCGEQLREGESGDLQVFALDCLALNYRIGPMEANHLGIFDTATVAAVIDAALGVSYFDDQKKS